MTARYDRNLDIANGMGIPAHDQISNTYTNSNLSQVDYLRDGVLVATLVLTYDGNGNVLTVTRTV